MPLFLLIDIGNSRIKGALADAGGPLPESYFANEDGTAALKGVCARFPRLDGCVMANVGGRSQAISVTEQVKRLWAADVRTLTSSAAACGVRNGYSQPGCLGVDRWAAMVGAFRPGEALCVVDAGTAMTVDAVDPRGTHLGGAILAGFQLLVQSIRHGTAAVRVPASPTNTTEALFARETAEAVYGGAINAMAALAKTARMNLSAQCGAARAVITGGDAPLLLPHLGPEWEHDPLLVIRGMWRLAMEELLR